ncbi:50S ribosomal protein L10 [Aureispira anguillae]|uniref:Large ribosomal subunit protein uL10 n=1 Tax=Aureispira anguillae TaxID=2864201 RepID=A0A915YJ83_9BACT|nr:50S ribosomal protein L10 [Aureispira anguillae]BDS14108.1 50S ribosomal protein L10 [Aureispira anguillae]
MTKAEKTLVIEELAGKFADSKYFYVTDCSELNVETINKLRRTCFEQDIQLKVVKNTLIKKALEKAATTNEENYEDLYGVLKGASALMFTETGNAPAKLIKKFREDNEKPVLKAAFVESEVYVGDDQLDALVSIKSKEELIGDIILLLESPIKNLVGSLQSGGNTISGLLKALEERGE